MYIVAEMLLNLTIIFEYESGKSFSYFDQKKSSVFFDSAHKK